MGRCSNPVQWSDSSIAIIDAVRVRMFIGNGLRIMGMPFPIKPNKWTLNYWENICMHICWCSPRQKRCARNVGGNHLCSMCAKIRNSQSTTKLQHVTRLTKRYSSNNLEIKSKSTELIVDWVLNWFNRNAPLLFWCFSFFARMHSHTLSLWLVAFSGSGNRRANNTKATRSMVVGYLNRLEKGEREMRM